MSYSIAISKRGGESYYMRLRPHDRATKINIPLGKINQKLVDKIRGNVDELLRSYEFGILPSASTLAWVREQSAEFRERLAAAGIIPGQSKGERLDAFCKNYIKSLTVQDSTTEQLWLVVRTLEDFFGVDRDVMTITLADATAYRNNLIRVGSAKRQQPLAENTVRRYVGRCRQIFRSLGDANPFNDRSLPVGVGHDESKDAFVDVATINTVIANAGGPEWACAIALARFGGFRACEIPALTWNQIDWTASAIVLESPKTGRRIVPLFTELRPYLKEWFDVSPDRTGRVISSYPNEGRGIDAMRTQLVKIIQRAEIIPWPKVWQNLRATRETELLSMGFPIKSVTRWIGNSKAVAMKHYVMPLESDFQRAAGIVTAVTANVTAETGTYRNQPENGIQESRKLGLKMKNPRKSPRVRVQKITRHGLEP